MASTTTITLQTTPLNLPGERHHSENYALTVVTDQGRFEVSINAAALQAQCRKAARSKSRKSTDGALSVTLCRDPMTAPIIESPSSVILRKYCNAAATHYSAGGHTKAERNKRAMDTYEAEAKAIGMTLPDPVQAATMGTFNGEGSW